MRILFVPDYFWPPDHDLFNELEKVFAEAGIELEIFRHGNRLEDSIIKLKRYCADNKVDCLVSHLSGCLFIAGIISIPRIFINPDWFSAPENLKTAIELNDDALREYEVSERELWEAQGLCPSKIACRGKLPSKCWITYEHLDNSEDIKEQLIRFYEVEYHPDISLSSPKQMVTKMTDFLEQLNQY